MVLRAGNTIRIAVLIAPHFNVSATTSFIDPFRVANYLQGAQQFIWNYLSETGGEIASSSGLRVQTEPLEVWADLTPDMVLVSTSWSPEQFATKPVLTALKRWARQGITIGGLDTGGFVLAEAGLLTGKKATVHYEHIDALIEVAANTEVSEDMFVFDQGVFTCCGGTAAGDAALRILNSFVGESIVNATARYLFHHEVRGEGWSQNPKGLEPMGYVTPGAIREAIQLMEGHLETPLCIPQIAQAVGLSQRQLSRLFNKYVHRSAVEYYRDIRLDRARGLVTQTEMKLSEVATASGFNSQVHFSRAYRERFGLSPSQDRTEGRVPFEFRAWPMHSPLKVGADRG